MDESLLRELAPAVLGVLVRRGADFAAAEDAVQEALLRAWQAWPADPPRDPKAWLVTVAWRAFLDAGRSESARHRREERVEGEPAPGPATERDDDLELYFRCAHPDLSPGSAVALTLRAIGSVSTRPRPRSRRCTPMPAARPRPTGCRSWSGTTSCCG